MGILRIPDNMQKKLIIVPSDLFLTKKTAELCREHFPNRQISNLLVCRWGKAWRTKLGHIKPLKNVQFGSLIEINAILADPRVPEFVLEATLLHELIHYFQGFGSNHPRERRHPHRGGAVTNEFKQFGWEELLKKQQKWVKENFSKVYFEFEQKEKSQSAVWLK